MNFEQARIFCAVFDATERRASNWSRSAAAAVGRADTWVNTEMRKIWESHGRERMALRVDGRYVFSDVARDFYKQWSFVLEKVSGLQMFFQEQAVAPVIGIGVDDAIPKDIVYQTLRAFESFVKGEIQLVCREDSARVLLDRVNVGVDQFCILSDESVDKDRFQATTLDTLEIGFFAKPGRVANGLPLVQDDAMPFPQCMRSRRFLMPAAPLDEYSPDKQYFAGLINQFLKDVNVAPFVVGSFQDLRFLELAGLDGAGIFAFPVKDASAYAERNGLRLLGKATDQNQAPIMLNVSAYSLRNPRGPFVQEFISFLNSRRLNFNS